MRFVITRAAMAVAALFALSVLIFVCLRVLPGDVATVMAGTNATAERVARLRAQLGLDLPYPEQYTRWVGGVLHGDLGVSALTGQSTLGQIGERAQVTLPLIALSLAVAVAIGVPLGTLVVTRGRAVAQRVARLVSIVAGAVPALWGGLLLILLFGRGIGLVGVLPAQGFPVDGWASPGRAFASLVLPAVSVGVIAGAQIMRYTRSALAEVAGSDWIALSMASGRTRASAVAVTGLRIVAPQLLSVIGLTFAEMVMGVLVVENLFALPGLASMLVVDVGNRDLTKVQSELLALAAFFLLVGLLIDVLHALLDPRLRDAAAGAGTGEE